LVEIGLRRKQRNHLCGRKTWLAASNPQHNTSFPCIPINKYYHFKNHNSLIPRNIVCGNKWTRVTSWFWGSPFGYIPHFFSLSPSLIHHSSFCICSCIKSLSSSIHIHTSKRWWCWSFWIQFKEEYIYVYIYRERIIYTMYIDERRNSIKKVLMNEEIEKLKGK